MPSSLKRYQQYGDLHFITFSCHQRKPLLTAPVSRDIFEQELESVRHRFDWKIAAYVVMPEHIHLLTNEPALCPLSLALQKLKQQTSIKLRTKDLPRLWLPRYFDFNVITFGKYVEKIHYIHHNPVTRELASTPEQYPWSSSHFYSTGTQRTVTITPPEAILDP